MLWFGGSRSMNGPQQCHLGRRRAPCNAAVDDDVSYPSPTSWKCRWRQTWSCLCRRTHTVRLPYLMLLAWATNLKVWAMSIRHTTLCRSKLFRGVSLLPRVFWPLLCFSFTSQLLRLARGSAIPLCQRVGRTRNEPWINSRRPVWILPFRLRLDVSFASCHWFLFASCLRADALFLLQNNGDGLVDDSAIC